MNNRRKRLRTISQPDQNLDSFLDILTNTVGVLMFIGVFVTLLAVESTTVIRTPLVSKTRKTPHFFEVRGDKVIYIDAEEVERQISNFLATLPTCTEPNIPEIENEFDYYYYSDRINKYNNCLQEKITALQDFEARTKNYEVSFLDFQSLVYKPLNQNEGESGEQLNKEDSEFNQTLEQLDNQSDYLAFIVRPDSFSAFRRAREQALKQGFDVGWEPQEPDNLIIFGSGGRAIGVQ